MIDATDESVKLDADRARSAAGYHPDPTINAEVACDTLEAELADLHAGMPPRRWICPDCGHGHTRGTLDGVTHRCLWCGYMGPLGILEEQGVSG